MNTLRNILLPAVLLSLLATDLVAAKKGASTRERKQYKPRVELDENGEPKKKRSFFSLGKKDVEAESAEKAAEAARHHFPRSLDGIDFSIQPNGEMANDPLLHLWRSSEFQRRFAGRYGFLPEVEPELSDTNEIGFMRELGPLLVSDKQLAAYILKTNITATNSARMDFTLGSLYFQNGDFPSAAKSFQNALDKFPDFRRAHKNLGFTYLKMGSYADAVTPLSMAVELGDRDATTYGLIAFCYMDREQFIPAEAAYKQAILFQPDNADWRLGLVKALVAQEKFDEANRMVEEVLQRDPTSVDMWELQANIFAQQQKTKLAAVNYEVVRKLGKADPEMLFNLGDLYMTDEATDLALPVYLEAIGKNGANDVPRALRTAKILVSRGSNEEAKRLFASIREAAGSELKNADELELLKSEAKVAKAEGDPAAALKILESVVERDPLDGEALLAVGDLYLARDEVEKAEFRYDLASKISGFEADALVKLAQLRVKQEKYDDAIALLNKAQKIDPRDTVQNYLEAIERIRRTAA